MPVAHRYGSPEQVRATLAWLRAVQGSPQAPGYNLHWLVHVAINRKAGLHVPVPGWRHDARLNHRGQPGRKHDPAYVRNLTQDAWRINMPRLRLHRHDITTPELRRRYADRISVD